MTMPSLPAVAAAPPELRVDATQVIQHLKQRLTEEIAKAVVLEVALAESQERERGQAAELAQLRAQFQAAAPE